LADEAQQLCDCGAAGWVGSYRGPVLFGARNAERYQVKVDQSFQVAALEGDGPEPSLDDELVQERLHVALAELGLRCDV
jgi:hypothetical protein